MSVNEIQTIKNLIDKAQLESAKSEGLIEAIKKEWKKNYNTDDVEEIEKIKLNLERELGKMEERKQVLYTKLVESYDWELLEQELG